MLRFISFASGSAGNCCFLQHIPEGDGTNCGLLIDAGVSLRRLKKELAAVSLNYQDINAVLVTHDHLDHIRHLGSYCKRLHKCVYATPTLHAALSRHFMTREHIAPCRKLLSEDGETRIGPFTVRTFVVPHDATQTCGFAIKADGPAQGIDYVHITDCGKMTEEALSYAREATTVTIESNYDRDMLMNGKYPYELKMRICQGSGHLSNDECSEALAASIHPGLRHVFLCHLSQNNNTPELAVQAARAAIPDPAISLRALPRLSSTPLLTL